MNNQIEKPMRKDGETHEQRRAVRGNIPPADFVNCKRYGRPEERADEAVCVRHVIKIERTSRSDSRNETHFLDPKQNKWRPQTIQQLHGHEQDPERDLISRRSDCEREAVMPDEHSSLNRLQPRSRLSKRKTVGQAPRLPFRLNAANGDQEEQRSHNASPITTEPRKRKSSSRWSGRRLAVVSSDFGDILLRILLFRNLRS